MIRRKLAAVLAGLGLLLVTCAPAGEATPTPTLPTPTRAATATPTATATAVLPGVTPAATPTVTRAPPSTTVAPKYGGILKIPAKGEVERFDMQMLAAPGGTSRVWGRVFSKLVEWAWPKAGDSACDRPLYNDAAESWQWKDGTLEIKLRPGLKFHNKPPVNGREVTASDVVWSLNRAKQVQVRFEEYLRPIEEIKAVDKYTIHLVGKQPLPAVIYGVLASYYGATPLAPESAGPDGTWDDPYRSYIGTGPFMFKHWRPGVRLVFERNPNYHWKGKPYVDGIEDHIMPDPSTRLAAMRAGKIDWIDIGVSSTDVEAIKFSNPAIRVFGCPNYAGTGTIGIRTDLPPWNDVRVRRALFLAIDQDAIIKSALRGVGIPSGAVHHVMPLGLRSREDYPPEVRKYLYGDPAEARRLLTEAGFPKGFDTTLEVTRYYGSPWNETAEAVADMLAAVGIRARLRWLDRPLFAARMGSQDALMISSASSPDPYTVVRRHLSDQPPSVNRSRINDPEVDKMIQTFLVTTDEKRQRELLRDLMVRFVDQAYFYSLPSPTYWVMGQPRVKNFEAGAGNESFPMPFFENVWLDR